MPIQRRRRIFRPGPFVVPRAPLGVRPALIAGAVAVLVVGGVALLSLPSTLFGRVPATEGTVQAAPEGVAVVDGATLRLNDRVVRLRGVAAPARGRLCHGGDGRAFDCGAAAAQGLAALLRNLPVACRLAGRDAAGFTQGNCTAGGVELNRAVIAAGWARADGGANDLRDAETAAHAARAGLWGADGGAASF